MTTGPSAGPRRLGTLHAVEGRGVVRLEETFATDIDELRSSLTDPRRLSRWLGEVEGDLHQGGTFRARFVASGWEGRCRVEVCAPLERIVLKTESDDQPDGEFVVMLASDVSGTVMVIEDHGVPLDLLAAYGAGDQIHLEDLAAHVAGRERCDARTRWQELQPVYRQVAVGLT